jgi:hypothetical protein
MAGFNTQLSGVLYLTRAQYDALAAKTERMLYVVQETSGFSLYLGADALNSSAVTGVGVSTICALTQAQYDALDPPDDDTIYAIREAST